MPLRGLERKLAKEQLAQQRIRTLLSQKELESYDRKSAFEATALDLNNRTVIEQGRALRRNNLLAESLKGDSLAYERDRMKYDVEGKRTDIDLAKQRGALDLGVFRGEDANSKLARESLQKSAAQEDRRFTAALNSSDRDYALARTRSNAEARGQLKAEADQDLKNRLGILGIINETDSSGTRMSAKQQADIMAQFYPEQAQNYHDSYKLEAEDLASLREAGIYLRDDNSYNDESAKLYKDTREAGGRKLDKNLREARRLEHNKRLQELSERMSGINYDFRRQQY